MTQMKGFKIFLFVIISLLVSCTLSEVSEVVDSGTSPSPVQTAQPTLPISPITTASSEAMDVDSGSESDGRQAVFPNTIIVYQKEENDSQQQWTIYHTGRIVDGNGTEQQAQSEVKPLFDLVESSDFWELDNTYGPDDECLDCLKQVVTIYYKGDIKEITVIDPSTEIPQQLKDVLDRLDRLSS